MTRRLADIDMEARELRAYPSDHTADHHTRRRGWNTRPIRDTSPPTLGEQLSASRLRDALMGAGVGATTHTHASDSHVGRDPVRFAWHTATDCVGRDYIRCRVTYWGRWDVSRTDVVTGDAVADVWRELAHRGYISTRVARDRGAYDAFVLLGNVTPDSLETRHTQAA